MENEKRSILHPCYKCFFAYFGRFSICYPSGLCSDKYEWDLRKESSKDGK